MEGPSLVILSEELQPFVGSQPSLLKGATKLDWSKLKGKKLSEVKSWGKHFLMRFNDTWIRTHFLMFGSYRINNPRGREPKLKMKFGSDEIEFYSCAIKILEGGRKALEVYDWSIDIMDKKWRPAKALAALQAKPKAMVCDALMDQEIFAGVGNIIKNEVLFIERMHPETKIQDLTKPQLSKLIKSTRAYCKQFYIWKKANVLRRNWKVFRKKNCPICERVLTKQHTGKGKRRTFFCKNCQR